MFKFLSVFLLTLLPVMGQAQIVNTDLIDSQSELDYLLESGQIHPEQYRLLEEYFSIDLYRGQTQLNRLAREIEYTIIMDSLPDHFNAAPVESSAKKNFQTAVSYKIYQRLSENSSYRQLFSIRGRASGNLRYLLVTEKKERTGDYYFRERWIRLEQDQYLVELGNYIPDWGLAVTLGYHSDFLSKAENPQYKSILFPYLSRYNGLYLEYNARLRPVVMISYDRSHDLRGRLLAISLNYNLPDLEIGLIGNYHNLDNLRSGNNFCQFLMGGYLRWIKNEYEIEAEISESQFKNWAGIISFKKRLPWGGFRFQAWNYPSAYRNPYGGGKANSDYHTVTLEQTTISYHSRQNGEYGFFSQTNYKLNPYHDFVITANYWRDAGLENKFRIRFTDQVSLVGKWKSKVTFLIGDDDLSEDYGLRQHFRVDIIHSGRQTGSLRVSAEFKRVFYSYGRRDYLRAEMKFSRRITDYLSTSIKISRQDSDLLDGQPGYWFVFLEETIKFGRQAQVRVALDSKEGRRYNLLDSARINLQLTMGAG